LAEDHATSGDGFVATTADPTSRVGTPPIHKTERYGDAVFLEQQPVLLDLIPQRLLVFGLLLVAGLGLIGTLEALYAWMPALAQQTGGRPIAALDLSIRGSLAAWLSSLGLLAASIAAVLVYTIRRHRVDDYHGHYRVWLWAAMCWFLMATDLSSGLREGFRDLMIWVAGTRLLGDGSLWWVMAYGLLLGSIGVRLLIDMWPCRLSSAALLLAAGCYVAATSMHLGWPTFGGGTREILCQQGAAMAGHLWLLLAMGLHARYVLRDAQGRLPHRPVKTAEKKSRWLVLPKWHFPKKTPKTASLSLHSEGAEDEGSSTADGEWIAVDSPHGSAPPVLKRVSAPLAPAPAPSPTPVARPAPAAVATSPAASGTAEHKLSKAERKALKQRLIEAQRQRQRQNEVG
jgi:hypothetical protein